MRRTSTRYFWLGLLVLVPSGLLRAQDARTPESVLKEKGLKRSGALYVLPAEADVQKKLNEARAIYREIAVTAARKEQFERGIAAGRAEMTQMEQNRVFLNQQLAQATTAEENNRLIGMINALTGQMNLMRRQEADGDNHQVPGARLAMRREEFVQAVINLRQVVDTTDAEYKALAGDAEVKNALSALNKKGKSKVTLGPSRAYLTTVGLLKKVEGSVLTEDVELRKEGGVYWVDVTFNGKTTRPMVFDTGASSVVLPAEFAEEIGLKPGPNDQTVRARVADGSEVEARRAVIPSMRVGKFTVKDVECMVMPAGKKNVPPLLGQTFHKHFMHKFTPESGKLVLSKVETPESEAPAPKARSSARPGARGKR